MPVLIGLARSPFAPANGVLSGWHPVDLSAVVLQAAMKQAGVTDGEIGGLWIGCAEPVGAQGANLARAVALAAGLPERVGGLVIDRADTSGSAALHAAADALRCGRVEVAAVAGVCLASSVAPGANAAGRNYGTPWGDAPARRVSRRGGLLSSPLAAEAAASAADIDAETLRRWALRSFRLRAEAVSAVSGGSSWPACVGEPSGPAGHAGAAGPSVLAGHAQAAEPAELRTGIVAVETRPAQGASEDDARRGTTVSADVLRRLPDDISALPPMFAPDGLIDAVSFAPPADGVAVLVLSRDGRGIADLVHSALTAGDPLDPAGGLTAVHLGAGRDNGESLAAVEIAEPSAAGVLLVCQALGIEPEERERIVNVRGGTLAVGDAGAAEELRLCVDRIGSLASGELLAAVAAGTGGAAVTVWRRSQDPLRHRQ